MKMRMMLAGVLVLLALGLVACAGNGDGAIKGDETGTGGEPGLETAPEGGYSYHREGGIAGFCDDVTLSTDGTVQVVSCTTDPEDIVGTGELTADQLDQLNEWVNRLRTFERQQADPATADAMVTLIRFTGVGDEEPTEADLAAMEALALAAMRQVDNTQ